MNSKKLYSLQTQQTEEGFDDEFIKELAGLFVQHVPALSLELVEACKNKNWQQVYFCAHKMKASIDLLNIEEIKEVIRKISQQAKQELNTEQLPALAEQVNTVVKQCAEQLKEDFKIE